MIMHWHMKLRLYMRKKYPIETEQPWFFMIVLSLVSNFLFPVILYHLGLIPYRDGNGSGDMTAPSGIVVSILTQLWATIIPYQIIGSKKITKFIDGKIYLEKGVAKVYYAVHALGFVVLNVHATLWFYSII